MRPQILPILHQHCHLLKNIFFHSDNSAAVFIINTQSSKDKTVTDILRPLVLTLISFNIHLRAQHIPGIYNVLPDHISRFQVTRALLNHHNMDLTQTNISQHIRPLCFYDARHPIHTLIKCTQKI